MHRNRIHEGGAGSGTAPGLLCGRGPGGIWLEGGGLGPFLGSQRCTARVSPLITYLFGVVSGAASSLRT